eukprot:524379-Prymnesium_polylepis.1
MIWYGIHCAGRSALRLLFCGATKKFSEHRDTRGRRECQREESSDEARGAARPAKDVCGCPV